MKITEILIRWTPTFLAFPIAGVLSKLFFGSASTVAKSVGGGLVVGLVVGLIQFAALKKYGVTSSWIAATAIAVMIAGLINSYAFSFKFDSTSLAGSGLIAGLLVGLGQSLSQSRELKFVALWSIATTIAWGVAWFITSKVIVDPESQYHIFGSSGAIVATLGLGVCIKYIFPIANLLQSTVK